MDEFTLVLKISPGFISATGAALKILLSLCERINIYEPKQNCVCLSAVEKGPSSSDEERETTKTVGGGGRRREVEEAAGGGSHRYSRGFPSAGHPSRIKLSITAHNKRSRVS